MRSSATKGIDHVMVRVRDVEPMMELFGRELGLPVSWPVTRTDFVTYGWVSLGNINLEFWAPENDDDLPLGTTVPLFQGFALEPEKIQDSIKLLAERGVQCKPPRPYITKTSDGREVTNYTNSVLLDVSSPRNCVFFCEWGVEGTIFPWKEKLTTSERRAKERRQLKTIDGGPLGITGLLEIQLTASDISDAEAKWLAITGQDTTPIFLGEEVKLTLQRAAEAAIQSIVIGVRCLEHARCKLTELGMLGTSISGECSLRNETSAGLHIRFQESAA